MKPKLDFSLYEEQTKQFEVDDNVRILFIESLKEHITYVFEAGLKIGVENHLLQHHDDSKWGVEECIGYAKYFKGEDASNQFSLSWLHHIHHNPHHWQHWIFPDGFTPKESNVENGVIEMPKRFALEMIADWMGASRAYTKSWDMKDWLWDNIPIMMMYITESLRMKLRMDKRNYASCI